MGIFVCIAFYMPVDVEKIRAEHDEAFQKSMAEMERYRQKQQELQEQRESTIAELEHQLAVRDTWLALEVCPTLIIRQDANEKIDDLNRERVELSTELKRLNKAKKSLDPLGPSSEPLPASQSEVVVSRAQQVAARGACLSLWWSLAFLMRVQMPL